MANANVNFPGAINGVDGTQAQQRALYYQQFTGEVFLAFKENAIMKQYHRIRGISGAKSAGFGHVGKAKGRRHTPGTEITGQNISHAETVINIDDLIIADVFVPNLEEMMASYDVRAPYAAELGDALARIYDKTVLRVGLTAARSANAITGLPGGSTVTLPVGYAADTDANKAIMLADAIFTAAQTFMEKRSADASQAKCFITPADYYRLVRNKDLLNTDWGGLGSLAKGELPMVAGIDLVVTNFLPQQDDTAVIVGDNFPDGIDDINQKYAGDFSKVQALIMTPEAAGTLELLDFSLEVDRDVRRQGDLILAKQATGHGVLRPECAIEIVIP